MRRSPLLEIRDLRVSYGAIEALRGVSLIAQPGTTTAILGANGAGKSTLLRAVSGLVRATKGKVLLNGQDVTALPASARAKLGLAHAMEGRRLFKQLSVESNLRLAWSFGARTVPWQAALGEVYDRFPVLADKAGIAAGLLSGGQQQMVILSCATIRSPRVLLLDEPSLGLAPIIVTQIYDVITAYALKSGATILLAEQTAMLALRASDRGYVLRRGQVVQEGTSQALGAGSMLTTNYL